MPYMIVGNCVYRKNADGSRGKKKGCSKNPKKYMAALYHAESGGKFTRSKK